MSVINFFFPNTLKRIHYSLNMHGCINVGNKRPKYRRFCIIFDSECSYTIVTIKIMKSLKRKHESPTQWITRAGNSKNNAKAKVEFWLLESRLTKIVTSKYHVDDLTKDWYDNVIGIDLLTTIGIDLKFSNDTIECGT